jgi:hypothetical protein
MNHGGFLARDLHVPLIPQNPDRCFRDVEEQASNPAGRVDVAAGAIGWLDGWRLGTSPVLPALF